MTTTAAYPGWVRRAMQTVVRVEIWVVGAAVVLSIFWPRFLAAAVVTAAVFFPLRRSASGRFSIRTGSDIAIAALFLLSIANLWVSPLPEITRPQVLRLWSGFGLFYAAANWAGDPARLRRLLHGVIAAGLALALAAPFSVVWPTGKLPFVPAEIYQSFHVLVSDSIHPNVLGGTLALLLPPAAAFLLFVRPAKAWELALAALSTAGIGAALVISLSRGAVMASGVALLVLLLLRGRWGWMALAAAAAGTGYLAFRVGPERLVDLALSGSAVSGWNGRLEIWSRAVYMLQDFFFTGVGMGVFGAAVDRLYPFASYAAGSIHHAHNLFLQVGVDLGVPGLLAWLAVLAAGVAAAWQAYTCGRKTGDGLLLGAGAGLLAAQVALIIHGLTDAVTWGMVRPAPLVWLLWGMAAAAGRIAAQKAVESA